jgi:crossover junction endodeoxyribonuclease RusA
VTLPFIPDTEAEKAEGLLRIDLPWPDKVLWPNGSEGNRHVRVRHAKNNRKWGYGAALFAIQQRGGAPEFAERIPVKLIIHAKPKGPLPDKDNCVAAAKHLLDGIADALVVNDRRFTSPVVEFAAPRDGRFVVELGA